MHAEALPPDIDSESRCRLPLPNHDDLDEAGKQTFDLLNDPHGVSLAGLRGPGGLRLHSPRVAAALRPVNTYLRDAAGFTPRLRELAIFRCTTPPARAISSAIAWKNRALSGSGRLR
jgi:4-carboxymuconolactone decarboxylase